MSVPSSANTAPDQSDSTSDVPVTRDRLPLICHVMHPGTRQQGTQQQGTQQPGTQQPGTWQPSTWQPGTQQPGTWQPVTWQPGTQQPGTWQPGTQQPGTWEPGTWQPGTWQPGTRQPETRQPGTQQPGTWRTGAQRPETRQPDTQQTDTRQPDTQQTGTRQPDTRQMVTMSEMEAAMRANLMAMHASAMARPDLGPWMRWWPPHIPHPWNMVANLPPIPYTQPGQDTQGQGVHQPTGRQTTQASSHTAGVYDGNMYTTSYQQQTATTPVPPATLPVQSPMFLPPPVLPPPVMWPGMSPYHMMPYTSPWSSSATLQQPPVMTQLPGQLMTQLPAPPITLPAQPPITPLSPPHPPPTSSPPPTTPLSPPLLAPQTVTVPVIQLSPPSVAARREDTQDSTGRPDGVDSVDMSGVQGAASSAMSADSGEERDTEISAHTPTPQQVLNMDHTYARPDHTGCDPPNSNEAEITVINPGENAPPVQNKQNNIPPGETQGNFIKAEFYGQDARLTRKANKPRCSLNVGTAGKEQVKHMETNNQYTGEHNYNSNSATTSGPNDACGNDTLISQNVGSVQSDLRLSENQQTIPMETNSQYTAEHQPTGRQTTQASSHTAGVYDGNMYTTSYQQQTATTPVPPAMLPVQSPMFLLPPDPPPPVMWPGMSPYHMMPYTSPWSSSATLQQPPYPGHARSCPLNVGSVQPYLRLSGNQQVETMETNSQYTAEHNSNLNSATTAGPNEASGNDTLITQIKTEPSLTGGCVDTSETSDSNTASQISNIIALAEKHQMKMSASTRHELYGLIELVKVGGIKEEVTDANTDSTKSSSAMANARTGSDTRKNDKNDCNYLELTKKKELKKKTIHSVKKATIQKKKPPLPTTTDTSHYVPWKKPVGIRKMLVKLRRSDVDHYVEICNMPYPHHCRGCMELLGDHRDLFNHAMGTTCAKKYSHIKKAAEMYIKHVKNIKQESDGEATTREPARQPTLKPVETHKLPSVRELMTGTACAPQLESVTTQIQVTRLEPQLLTVPQLIQEPAVTVPQPIQEPAVTVPQTILHPQEESQTRPATESTVDPAMFGFQSVCFNIPHLTRSQKSVLKEALDTTGLESDTDSDRDGYWLPSKKQGKKRKTSDCAEDVVIPGKISKAEDVNSENTCQEECRSQLQSTIRTGE